MDMFNYFHNDPRVNCPFADSKAIQPGIKLFRSNPESLEAYPHLQHAAIYWSNISRLPGSEGPIVKAKGYGLPLLVWPVNQSSGLNGITA
jgi:hypothetical protein